MRKIFFTLFLALVASVGTIFAEVVKIGDLYYVLDVTNKTAKVSGANKSDLTVANIPETVIYWSNTYCVTSIGKYAFYDCSGLTSVTIPNSVTSIENHAFDDCSGLTSVTIPNSVTSIGDGAFYYCSKLTSVTIGNSVTSIGEGAFVECTGLTSVTISDLTAWCNIDFSNGSANPLSCAKHLYLKHYNLTKKEIVDLVIPNNVTSIGNYAFAGCSGLTSVTIPNSVTSIGDGAFGWCSGLTSVTIPNSVTSIGNYAFYDCSKLTSVTIPNSVTSIGDGAFGWCSGLTSITCHAVTPPNIPEEEEAGVFDDVDKSIPLYVPKGSVSAYKNANQWKEFTNIRGVEMAIDEVATGIASGKKTIRNGQLYIQRGDDLFNAQGARVK